jgi:N utilization substance protein B
MQQSRIIRQQTLQILCQYDSGNSEVASITGQDFNEELSKTVEPNAKVAALAKHVWEDKEKADARIVDLTPEWPTHRQPLVDRNILRLAHYEITSKMTPPIVAIDEAVELAKEFGTQESPAFINGVLNQVMEQFQNTGTDTETATP